ncbi:VOC family protein [Hymenobacter sp. 15J16-1T3B]|uniref:VOC family protein n=1 Tax=Hymenobacter sp. 15J16-1T3B TaxID=2886941 RepID=UPI001D1156C6|nr:VOC family protein [Hymenobacter sp. 15J16-1T3B]MCC3158236.1 VOC family protein [Hymenobacter sp. 15J16-1T3B]
MKFVSARIITADLPRLVQFYEHVTGLAVTRYTEDFVEMQMATATLAIATPRTLALSGGDAVAQPAANRSVFLEFRVTDVDADYQRLAAGLDAAAAVVQAPTTMPWGNRSLLLRDPDGNLVNLFAPVTPEAQRRYDG